MRAQAQVKPRFVIGVDTSGSMSWDLSGNTTYGGRRRTARDRKRSRGTSAKRRVLRLRHDRRPRSQLRRLAERQPHRHGQRRHPQDDLRLRRRGAGADQVPADPRAQQTLPAIHGSSSCQAQSTAIHSATPARSTTWVVSATCPRSVDRDRPASPTCGAPRPAASTRASTTASDLDSQGNELSCSGAGLVGRFHRLRRVHHAGQPPGDLEVDGQRRDNFSTDTTTADSASRHHRRLRAARRWRYAARCADSNVGRLRRQHQERRQQRELPPVQHDHRHRRRRDL